MEEMAWEITHDNHKRITMYKVVDGKVIPMPNLPSDPYNLRKFLRKGFKLEPPKNTE